MGWGSLFPAQVPPEWEREFRTHAIGWGATRTAPALSLAVDSAVQV